MKIKLFIITGILALSLSNSVFARKSNAPSGQANWGTTLPECSAEEGNCEDDTCPAGTCRANHEDLPGSGDYSDFKCIDGVKQVKEKGGAWRNCRRS